MKRVISLFCVVVLAFSVFAFSNQSLDGRALIAPTGVFPKGDFGRAPGFLPGDTVIVTNHGSGISIEVMILETSDPSEGVAIVLSPEAAKKLKITSNYNAYVKIQKKQILPYEKSISSESGESSNISVETDPDKTPNIILDLPVKDASVEEITEEVVEESVEPKVTEEVAEESVEVEVEVEVIEEVAETENPVVVPLEDVAEAEEIAEAEIVEAEEVAEAEIPVVVPLEDVAETEEIVEAEEVAEAEIPVVVPLEDIAEVEEDSLITFESTEDEYEIYQKLIDNLSLPKETEEIVDLTENVEEPEEIITENLDEVGEGIELVLIDETFDDITNESEEEIPTVVELPEIEIAESTEPDETIAETIENLEGEPVELTLDDEEEEFFTDNEMEMFDSPVIFDEPEVIVVNEPEILEDVVEEPVEVAEITDIPEPTENIIEDLVTESTEVEEYVEIAEEIIDEPFEEPAELPEVVYDENIFAMGPSSPVDNSVTEAVEEVAPETLEPEVFEIENDVTTLIPETEVLSVVEPNIEKTETVVEIPEIVETVEAVEEVVTDVPVEIVEVEDSDKSENDIEIPFGVEIESPVEIVEQIIEPTESVKVAVETVVEAPVETVVEAPVETVVEAPVETVVEAPVETVVETIVETVVEAPIEVVKIEEPSPVVKKEISSSNKAQMLNSSKDFEKDMYYIQIATYSKQENVDNVIEKYGNKYPMNLIKTSSGAYQVLIGPLSTDDYSIVLERFKARGFKDAFIRIGK